MAQLAMVFSSQLRTGFDFVGEFVEQNDRYIKLKNPLVMDYSEGLTLIGLRPMHLPVGTVDITEYDTFVCLPHEAVGYMVLLPKEGTDYIHLEYEKIFNNNPIPGD